MNIAIIGSGKLIPTAMEAILEVPELVPEAIFARPQSAAKAGALAERYHIHRVFTDYDALLADPSIEAVYIALVNTAHFEYAKKALLAGRHVLLEKPFTTTAADARELRALALQGDAFLMEALTSRHALTYRRMLELLPKVGAVRLVLANYSQYSSRYDAYLRGEVLPAFDPALQGGALFDLNIYNIGLMAGLFGRPETVVYRAHRGFNGVDTSGTLLAEYPGFTAALTAAKDSESPGYFQVQGERGWVRIDGAPNDARALSWSLPDGEGSWRPAPDKNRMVREFRDFSALVAANDRAEMQRELDKTVISMEIVEAALE